MDFTAFELKLLSELLDEQFVREKLMAINRRLNRFLSVILVNIKQNESENIDQTSEIRVKNLEEKLNFLMDTTTDMWIETISE